MLWPVLCNETGIGGFKLVRVDVLHQNLIKGHAGKPAGHGLRPIVADRPEHPASGLADKHNFPTVGEEINPATQDLGDIGKVFQFHLPTMTDSDRKSSGHNFLYGEVFKINFGF